MRRTIGCGGGCFGAVFGLGGLIALVIGLVWGYNSWQRTQTNVETQGVVVDLLESRDSDGDRTFRPVIEFVAENGLTYTLQSNFGRSDPPEIGETIGVYYDRDDPNDASESSWLALWLGPLILTVMGSIFVIVGVGVAFFSRRIGRRLDPDDQRPLLVFEDTPIDVGAPHDVRPFPDERPEFAEPATPTRGQSFRAEYRGVEPSEPSDEGRFRYRVVARADDGETYYSDWLDNDPTMTLMGAGIKEVDVEWRDGRYVIAAEWLA